jgi:hypothetical protein
MLPRGGSSAPPPPPPRTRRKIATTKVLRGLPDDGAAEEAAAEQLLTSFEMQCRDEAARYFMHVERRAAAERLADAQETACATAHRRNLEAAMAAMAAAEQRLVGADRSGGLASVAEARHHHENQYPCLPTSHGRSARRTA